MSNKFIKHEEQSSLGAKLALTAGSLSSLYLLPVTSHALIQTVSDRPISVSFQPGSIGGISVDWNVDGIAGVDFQLWLNTGNKRISILSQQIDHTSLIKTGTFKGRGIYGGAGGSLHTNAANRQFSPIEFLNTTPLNNGGQFTPGIKQVFDPGNNFGKTALYPLPVYRNLMFRTNEGAIGIGNPGPAAQRLLNFNGNGDNYFAFRFLQNGTSLIGWADMLFNTQAGSVTISQWAYCDPNNVESSIFCGNADVAPVPEPSTASLALIGLGAAGVRAWRARRRTSEVSSLSV